MRNAFLILYLSLALTACSGDSDQTQQASPPEVSVIQVKAKDTPVTTEFVGKTASSRKVEIRSRVEGFLEHQEYVEGSMVEEGQVLFQMDRKPFEVALDARKAELAQQQARLATASANLKRVKPLAKKKAVAQKELDDALGTYRSAAAAVEEAQSKVAQAELNLGYTTIKSPLKGISSFAVQREGAFIGLGTDSLLTYVAQIDPMWVEFNVSENQILRQREAIAKGGLIMPEDGNYVVEIVLADGTVYPDKGRITFADASLSEETGTFLIRAEFANKQELLRPGQFVRVRVHGLIRPNAILVPIPAVQQGAKGSFVWVITKEGKAEFRPIQVGQWQGDQWFVDKGLEDGDTVVVEGALKLRADIPVKTVPADQKENTENSDKKGEGEKASS